MSEGESDKISKKKIHFVHKISCMNIFCKKARLLLFKYRKILLKSDN